MRAFGSATRQWFDATFQSPTQVQREGWERIVDNRHALLVAPTGSGKTLAAFLAGIDATLKLSPEAEPGVRVLYVSPLKALVYDVERNLRAPLIGIARTAQLAEQTVRDVSVAVRTGDTPQRERQQQVRHPSDILVTTPESLFLMLGSRARETLRSVHTVIVDEIHAMAGTKRGTHLALSLERLSELAEDDPQRIGLSATVRPLDEVARFLGGHRDVDIVDASAEPLIDLLVKVPVPDMDQVRPPQPKPQDGGSILGELYSREAGTPSSERGIWPALYPEILEAIRRNRSTIVFVNSRGLCERLTQRLNEMAEEELVLAHHGSVSHEKRADIEEQLKAGAIKGIVATSSLELGIDMGAVDRVVLVESPGSVARGLQRVGRAGHQVGVPSVGRVYPKFKGDLLESTVVGERMVAADIEAVRIPKNALDVLSQQIVAMCCDTDRTADQIESLVKRAYPFHGLTTTVLQAVLNMLSGAYPSTDFADLRPLLSWDRTSDTLSARRGAPMVSRLNAGTIPDRGLYRVRMGDGGPPLGELDEEMVFETRPGDNIMLGASTWRVDQITRDTVVVSPAPGEPGRLPFWRGDGPGRPIELGRALGRFVREAGEQKPKTLESWLLKRSPLNEHAAGNLANYLREQQDATSTLPSDTTIVAERFRDELGDWRICILSPFGSRIHAPWSMALQNLLSTRSGYELQQMYTDDGIVLRFADADELPALETLLPDPDQVEELITEQMAGTALFAGLFRENAARALLLPRRRAQGRNPLWAQRLKSQQLLAVAQQFPSFPIVLETYRQALQDVFDLEGLKQLLSDIRSRRVRVVEAETRSASPFARSLVFAYVAAYLYEGDSPLAERKAQALTLDRNLLGELLGQAELRELIDRDVLETLEDELQGLADERRAKDADQLHDRLRRLGDLNATELSARSEGDPEAWLTLLADERRAAEVAVAGERRWIAAQDAGLYRDALGVAPPPGLPEAFVAEVPDALTRLIRRYARTRGPFTARQAGKRFGLRVSVLQPVLNELEREQVLVRGEIRPDSSELDWCDAEILRRLRRRTLAKLRNEVAAVDGSVLGRYLPAWHGVGDSSKNPDRLLEIIGQLEGLPMAWSSMVGAILPQRMPDFRVDALDLLCATGVLVWVGCASLGPKDGRVALYFRDHVARLLTPPEHYESPSDIHAAILDQIEKNGASFLNELESAARQSSQRMTATEFREALWDLVWAGQITNDTVAPLRALGQKASARRGRRSVQHAGGRWSLVARLRTEDVSDTERTLARANLMLERYGVVSREAVRAESIQGGWGPVYKVLKAMEESGRIRRGYFVEGLGGAQFGHVGAVDRLRAHREDDEPWSDEDVVILSSVDPANPWGTLLPWPETGNDNTGRPRRVPGTWVVLARGKPALYVTARASQILTFPSTLEQDAAVSEYTFRALHKLPRGTRRRSHTFEKIDGIPIAQSERYQQLLSLGFERDYRGLTTSATA